jgi:phospholipase/lecithinase/hemolysin
MIVSAKEKPADLSRFVVMGDSLSAGVENFSLLYSQQPNGYGSLIADQAHTPLPLPLVPYPGAPNVLQLKSGGPPPGPPPVIEPAPGTLLFPRLNPLQEPFNISVPGITVGEAITMRPTLDPNAPPVQQWATIVLGFPALLLGQAPTELETAVALHPTTIIEALGNNDALVPALVGQLAALTPLAQFTASYQQVLDTLSNTKATIITANIPDVTEVPYFTPVASIAQQAGVPVGTVDALLGTGPADYVRLSGLALVDGILSGTIAGPLPASCPSPLAALSPSPIPCVLTAADAATLRSAINAYNGVIAAQSASHHALEIDLHSLVDQISASGYSIGTKTLTTSFLGGLFSLDGIHPTNTGYGIIANFFIQAMNANLNTHLAQVKVPAIAAKDPLVF